MRRKGIAFFLTYGLAATALAQSEATDFFRVGAQHLAQGQVDLAIQSFEKGVALRPDAKEGWYNLGVAYGRKRLFSKEAQAYEKALELDPNYVNALHNLGLALRDLGQLQRAAQVLERAVGLDPSAADTWNNLGVVRMDLGDFDGAVAAFRKASEADPSAADPWFNSAVALIRGSEAQSSSEKRQAMLREAVRACDEALSRNPNHYRAAYNQALALHMLGEYDKEIEALKAALRIRPRYFEALYNLAVAQTAQGRNEEALRAWEAYVDAASADPNERPFVETARKEIERLKKK